MADLHEALAERITLWRQNGYPPDRFPAVGELLRCAVEERREDHQPKGAWA